VNIIRTIFLALVPLPIALAAQQGSVTGFYMLSGNDTLFAERSVRTPSELSGDFIDLKRGARIAYVAALSPTGLVTRLETRLFATGIDTLGRMATFDLAGDSAVVDVGAGRVSVKSGTGALAILNASPAFIEQVVLHARAVGGGKSSVTFPVFIVQMNQPSPITVTFGGGDSATVRFANVAVGVRVTASGELVAGEVPAQKLTIVRGAPPRVAALVNRYAAPLDAPYTAEDVEVRTPSGLRLTGTLTIPKSRATGRVPAIVTITGSGAEDRNEESPLLPGIRPYAELADTLGRRGIAVLRLDDRGINGSDIGPASATSADFANDIRAGIAYLRTRREIYGARIGLVGHSEGAAIAPMIAATDSTIRAIVLLAGAASTGREIAAMQARYVIDSIQHLTGAARESAFARSRFAADSVARAQPWMEFFFDYDPSAMARRVTTPVLILQGERDTQVPSSEAATLAAAFRAGGNGHVTVRMFPETNHLFLADPSGAFSDATGHLRYGALPSLHVRREVLGAIADWLTERFR
jgi:pimeloyl-ACP methyl ester carboxylesterase